MATLHVLLHSTHYSKPKLAKPKGHWISRASIEVTCAAPNKTLQRVMVSYRICQPAESKGSTQSVHRRLRSGAEGKAE
eukprot:1310360-Amphidinium_carterae.1